MRPENEMGGLDLAAQGVLSFKEETKTPTQKNNTTKQQRFIADGLNDTGVFEHRLLPTYCVEGSPRWKAIHQCVRCRKRTDACRPIGWGNSAGPDTVFMLCGSCYKRRQRFTQSDRELFDLTIKIRLLREIHQTEGGHR